MTTITANSLKGKHDFQLQDEMDRILKDANLNAHISFERKRGRATLVIQPNCDAQQVINLFMSEHPTFHFSYENPSISGTRFLIYVDAF